ncbi:MAG: hypothetical protein LBK46_08140 [Oscillospiraceae bacterium]|jgi:hypothetical protein|nr:hypothetical protein [Oscillospiraceae bacterium]
MLFANAGRFIRRCSVCDGGYYIRIKVIAALCLAAALTPFGFARAIDADVVDPPVASWDVRESAYERLTTVCLIDEFAITSRDTPLYAAPNCDARSDSYMDAMTIVRLDAYMNGFMRVRGSEWFVAYDDVDNVSIDPVSAIMFALPLRDEPLRAGAGAGDPALNRAVMMNRRVCIEGSRGEAWLIEVGGVYGFVQKELLIVMPVRTIY